MELKKAANHPYLFDGAVDYSVPQTQEDLLKNMVMASGTTVLLDKLLARLRADGHRVLIFSQMVKILDILSDYLGLRGYLHQRLDGAFPQARRTEGRVLILVPPPRRYDLLGRAQTRDRAFQRAG